MPVHRATFSLTGWETDANGQLVCTDGGAIVIPASGEGIVFLPDDDTNVNHRVADVRYSGGSGVEIHAQVDGESITLATWNGTWELRSDGVLRASSGGQRIWMHAGAADAPAYSFYLSDGAGMFRAGADILGFSTGYEERWRIDAAGKLIPTIANQVPASPTVQQVVTVLVALGILTQAA